MGAEAGHDASSRDGDTLPSADEVAEQARVVMEQGWCDAGFTAPNAATYPWQWLWDSCFHSVIWAALGDDRAAVELASVFDAQEPSGFVPHINYRGDDAHAAFWGRPGTSCITQPPLYGHAAAELVRRGVTLDDRIVEAAEQGLLHLLACRPRHESGLVPIVHPWESGADDSPRWDHWCPGGFARDAWFRIKGELVRSIEFDYEGAPTKNEAFDPAPSGFNALVAFNALELSTVTGASRLSALAVELAENLVDRWDESAGTWPDAGRSREGSGRVRTLDALLPVLVAQPAQVRPMLAPATNDRDYGGECGPAGVHRDEAVFEPTVYWRGPAWPQLTYLLWVAAGRADEPGLAADLAHRLCTGSIRSRFAEYWHPDSGEGLGARPQCWAALAAVVR